MRYSQFISLIFVLLIPFFLMSTTIAAKKPSPSPCPGCTLKGSTWICPQDGAYCSVPTTSKQSVICSGANAQCTSFYGDVTCGANANFCRSLTGNVTCGNNAICSTNSGNITCGINPKLCSTLTGKAKCAKPFLYYQCFSGSTPPTCEGCQLNGSTWNCPQAGAYCNVTTQSVVCNGNNANCFSQQGSVKCGANARCSSINGNVTCGPNAYCFSTHGNVTCGNNAQCNSVSGHVTCGANPKDCANK